MATILPMAIFSNLLSNTVEPHTPIFFPLLSRTYTFDLCLPTPVFFSMYRPSTPSPSSNSCPLAGKYTSTVEPPPTSLYLLKSGFILVLFVVKPPRHLPQMEECSFLKFVHWAYSDFDLAAIFRYSD